MANSRQRSDAVLVDVPLPPPAENEVTRLLLARPSAGSVANGQAAGANPICDKCKIKPASLYCYLCAEKKRQLCADCGHSGHDWYLEDHHLRKIEDRKFKEHLMSANRVATGTPCCQFSVEVQRNCDCQAYRLRHIEAIPGHLLSLKKDLTFGPELSFAGLAKKLRGINETGKTVSGLSAEITARLVSYPLLKELKLASLEFADAITKQIMADDFDTQRDARLSELSLSARLTPRCCEDATNALEVAKFMEPRACVNLQTEWLISVGLRNYVAQLSTDIARCVHAVRPDALPVFRLDGNALKALTKLDSLMDSAKAALTQLPDDDISHGQSSAMGPAAGTSKGEPRRVAEQAHETRGNGKAKVGGYIENILDNGATSSERCEAGCIADVEKRYWQQIRPGDRLCTYVKERSATSAPKYRPMEEYGMNVELTRNSLNFVETMRNPRDKNWLGKWMESLLETFPIGDDDERTGLQGQKGVRARMRIAQFTILGPYHGVALKPGSAHDRSLDLSAELEYLQAVDPNIQPVHIHDYAFELPLEKPPPAFCAGREMPEHLLISAVHRGNILTMVNAIEEGQIKRRNVDVAIVRKGDFGPVILFYAYRQIEKGAELLMDYGGPSFFLSEADAEWYASMMEDPRKLRLSDRFLRREREQKWELQVSSEGKIGSFVDLLRKEGVRSMEVTPATSILVQKAELVAATSKPRGAVPVAVHDDEGPSTSSKRKGSMSDDKASNSRKPRRELRKTFDQYLPVRRIKN